MDGTLGRALVAATLVIGSAMGRPCGWAEAQILVSPRARQGYYFTLGYSLFGTEQWASGRPREVARGGLFTYGLGQMLTDRWGLGFRAEGGGGAGGSGKGRTWTTFGLGLDAQLNPVSNLALHLGLGVGVDSVTDSLDLEKPTRAPSRNSRRSAARTRARRTAGPGRGPG